MDIHLDAPTTVRGDPLPRPKHTRADQYTVGYGRPPRSTQFKTGKSGNPKGRPKGSRPIGALLQDIVQQRVAVTDNGKARQLPALEVMLRRLTADAMRSDQKAIKLLLSLLDRYSESPEATLELRELLSEDELILAEYLPDQEKRSPSTKTKRR